MAAETPCSVLYNDIRSFGGLKHLEIARMLINGNSYLGSTRSTFPRQSAASSAAASPPIGQSPSTIAVRPPTK